MGVFDHQPPYREAVGPHWRRYQLRLPQCRRGVGAPTTVAGNKGSGVIFALYFWPVPFLMLPGGDINFVPNYPLASLTSFAQSTKPWVFPTRFREFRYSEVRPALTRQSTVYMQYIASHVSSGLRFCSSISLTSWNFTRGCPSWGDGTRAIVRLATRSQTHGVPTDPCGSLLRFRL